mgnify:CR=1 FL=1|tara:strand:+ start:15861 stop:18047 length:2187 start_codon:yes stop_codon:yes gene_type:complete
MKKVYSYKTPKYQAGGEVIQKQPFPTNGSQEEIMQWYATNQPQGAMQPQGTIRASEDDSFMTKLHAFAQNPFTVAKNLYQKGGEWTNGIGGAIDAGVVEREAFDLPIDLVNLPGAVSKVTQGIQKGDLGKTAYGALQAIPYAGTIGKGVQGAMKGVSPYLDDAANAVSKFGDDAMHAYKNVASRAMPGLDKTTAKLTAKMGVKHAPEMVSNVASNVPSYSPTSWFPSAMAQPAPMNGYAQNLQGDPGPNMEGPLLGPQPEMQSGGMVNTMTGLIPSMASATSGLVERMSKMDPEDFLIPQSVQNMIPLNVRAFANDLMGNDSEINERHLSQAEKDALQSAREKAEKAGKSFIEYGDYDTDSQYGDVGGDANDTTAKLASRLLDPSYSAKTTFGQIGFKKNEDGTYTYTDQYNFNNAKEGGMDGFRKELEENPDLTAYQKLRKLAEYKGSGPGEGADVNITYGKGGQTKPQYMMGGSPMGPEYLNPSTANQAAATANATGAAGATGAGGPAVPWGQIGQLAGGLATQHGMSDGTYDSKDAGISTGLSMAGQGASMGMAFGPIGAGVGAIVGGVGGFFLGKSQRKKQMEEERKLKEAGIDSKIASGRANDAVKSAAIMAQYPQDGVDNAGYYAKYGGHIPTEESDYTVEGGELMMAPNGNPPKTDQHGKATKVGENMFKFTGDTHDAKSGGIGVAGGNTEFATQTNQVLNSGFVFSDRLKTDATNYLKDI